MTAPKIPVERPSEAETAVLRRGAEDERPTTPTLPPAPSAEEDPLLGRWIAGKYKIGAQIAKGGMGRIYRAEQAPLGRLVAIKVVNAKFAADDPEYEKRFFLEASVVSQLTHPNTVTVFDYGKTEDGTYFMAMELLTGRTLHRLVKAEGPLPALRAIRIVRQVCRSVREAHDLGVVHRDLKPANVFLADHPDEEDFVKVLDFGLAKHVEDSADGQLTQTGLFMGSPKYMAPEQVDGRSLDGRADIYSVGILTFEILCGRAPFEKGTSVTTLMAHVTDPVPILAEFAPEVAVPAALERVVRRCLEKRPEDRFPDMEALLGALRDAEAEILAGATAPLLAPGKPPPPPSPLATAEGLAAAARLPSTPPPPSAAPSFEVLLPRSAEPAIPPPAAAPGRARIFFALAAVALAGGAAFAVGRRTDGTPAPPPATAAPAPSASAPRAMEPAIPPATVVEVPITSDPPGAEVRDEAGLLCAKTPCTLRLVPEELDLERRLTTTRAGYVRDVRTAPLRGGIRIALTAAPKGRGAPSAPVVDGFKAAY